MILGIDPGLKGHAYAIGNLDGVILCSGFYKGGLGRGGRAWVHLAVGLTHALSGYQGRLTRCVVEVPQVYTRGRGDPGDLIEIAGAAGAVCLGLHALGVPADSIVTVLPKTWKGQVPKEVHHYRILEQLSDQEKSLLSKTGLQDQLDAVGLVKYMVRNK